MSLARNLILLQTTQIYGVYFVKTLICTLLPTVQPISIFLNCRLFYLWFLSLRKLIENSHCTWVESVRICINCSRHVGVTFSLRAWHSFPTSVYTKKLYRAKTKQENTVWHNKWVSVSFIFCEIICSALTSAAVCEYKKKLQNFRTFFHLCVEKWISVTMYNL